MRGILVAYLLFCFAFTGKSQVFKPTLSKDQFPIALLQLDSVNYLVAGSVSNGLLFKEPYKKRRALVFAFNSFTEVFRGIQLATTVPIIEFKRSFHHGDSILLFGTYLKANDNLRPIMVVLDKELRVIREVKFDFEANYTEYYIDQILLTDSTFILATSAYYNLYSHQGNLISEYDFNGSLMKYVFFENQKPGEHISNNYCSSLTRNFNGSGYFFTLWAAEERLYSLSNSFEINYLKDLPYSPQNQLKSYYYNKVDASRIIDNQLYFALLKHTGDGAKDERQIALLVYDQNLDSLTTLLASTGNGYHYLSGFDADSLGNKYLVGYDKFLDYDYPDASQSNKVLFSKVNPDNSIAYTKSYSDGSYFLPQRIIALANGGCAITGFRYKEGETDAGDPFIMLLDVKGNVTALSSFTKQTTVKLFPNPSSGSVMLEWPSDKQLARLSIYNVAGKLLFEKQGNMQQGEYLSLEFLAAGMYLVNLYFEDGETLSKLLELNHD